MRFIISFTTSPCRISKCKTIIDAILSQSKQPDLIILNIPEVFPRTNEKYVIPDFIQDKVVVNVIKQDYGPATKLLPTVKYLKNNNYDIKSTYIIYLDDDIRYTNNMIDTFHFLFTLNKQERVLCGGGFHFVVVNGQIRLSGQRKHGDSVSVVEGYAAVCTPLSIFKEDFVPYMEKYTLDPSKKECLLSDDVIFSNYYSMKKIPMNVVNIPGKYSLLDLWKYKCILDYGNQADALHCGANGTTNTNVGRYPSVLKTLKENNELHIQVYNAPTQQSNFINTLYNSN